MAKKIISVLGIGNYKDVKYEFLDLKGNKQIVETRFVQEAIHKLVGKDAILYVGLTEGKRGSRNKNWESGYKEIKDWDTCEEKEIYEIGLKDTLVDKKIDYREISLENGENQGEIWENFDRIFQVLEEKDEVYIDITHSFRSIPVIIMSIINYAKFIKNITIGGIYYGAFEAKNQENIAPIFDLSIFNSITDWTIGAEKFISSGDSSDLIPMIDKNIDEYKKQIKRADQESEALNEIKKSLDNFSKGLYTVRGKVIPGNGLKLKRNLKGISTISINALKPLGEILSKISEKVDSYSGHNLKDLNYTVKLYKDLNLIQQAYTLLRENIVTFVALAGGIEINDIGKRISLENIINSRTSIKKIEVAPKNKELEEKVKNYVNKDLGDLFYNIVQIRNDLNHGGYRENAAAPDTFNKKLDEFILKFEDIVDIDGLKLKNSISGDKNREHTSKKMLLIFSHKLTDRQIKDAKENLNIEEFIYLPPELQKMWSSISPEIENLSPILEDIKKWVDAISDKDDYILIQGDFGANYEMVSYCKDLGLKPIYSTTKRQANEILRKDGKIELAHIFEHIRFRQY